MKVIFLDIDGVMNSNVFYEQKYKKRWLKPITYYLKAKYIVAYIFNGFKPKYYPLKFDLSPEHAEYLFSYDYTIKRLKEETDPLKWEWLSYFCNKHDYKICISSVWKNNFKVESDWNKALIEFGFNDGIFVGITGNKFKSRGDEIKEWLQQQERDKKYFESYAILDDDSDMLPEQMPNFFYVDRWYGLSPHYLYRINKLFTEVNKQYYGNKSRN